MVLSHPGAESLSQRALNVCVVGLWGWGGVSVEEALENSPVLLSPKLQMRKTESQ